MYKVGSGVYLKPDTFKFTTATDLEAKVDNEQVDSEVYPEYYRKISESIKGSNSETPQPFCIGIIEEIKDNSKDKLVIKVRKFYRPENTHKERIHWYQQDLNLLYWSDEGKFLCT